MRLRKHSALLPAILALLLFCAHHDVCAQWVATSKPLDMSIKALASNSTMLFVGGDCYDQVTKKVFGCVFRSSNKGNDWQKTSLKGDVLRALAVSGQVVFAGCYDGVYRSSDNGQTWAKGTKGL